jgi:predicted porin
MKKTLIAMAAVAVAGVASAQVTLSGKLAFGYQDAHTSKEAAGTGDAAKAKDVSGLTVTDGHFTMSGSEDLGGGLSAAASMEVLSRGRGTDISGRNASLTVKGGFGSVTIGAVEAGNGIMGLGQAGAPGMGLDGKVLEKAANVDILKYDLPAIVDGLGLSISVVDTTGSTTGRSAGYAQIIGATYSVGALSIAADHSDFRNESDVEAAAGTYYPAADAVDGEDADLDAYDATDVLPSGAQIHTTAVAAYNARDARTRISLSYDLGVAKVGYGRQTLSYDTKSNNDQVQTTMGVSVPMGDLTLGFATGKQTVAGKKDKKGVDMGVKYTLSKRTTVDFGRATWKTDGDSEKSSVSRIRLTHTF